MSSIRKTITYFLVVSLAIPTLFFGEKVSANTECPGVSPLTDPLAIRMENGERVIWDKVDPSLITAKNQYENLLKAKGWKIRYTSAYRPYQYQKHFYELVNAPSSPCKSAEIKKHGLVGVVAKPSPNAPHVKGIAFDGVVTDKNGKPLNGKNFVHSSLIAVAKQAGLKFPLTKTDGVHHEVSGVTSTLSRKAPSAKSVVKPLNAQGKITTPSGFNVRKTTSTSLKRIGWLKKNSKVTIVGKAGDWYKIKYGKGYGYIKAVKSGVTIFKKDQTFKTKGTVIASSGLNVRKAAHVGAAKYGTLKKGTKVNIIGISNGWYKIKYGNGYGWISGNKNYVKI